MNSKIDIALIITDQSQEWNSWTKSLSMALKTAIMQFGLGDATIDVFSITELQNVSARASILIVPGQIKNLQGFDNDSIVKLNIDAIVFPENDLTAALSAPIKKLPTYTFFDIDAETGFQRYYKKEGTTNESRLFWAKTLDLAFDLSKKLFLNELEVSYKQNIYLAQTYPDQFESRDAIRSELIHRGFNVLPEHNLSGSIDTVTAEISEYLEKCAMSVHIIGNNYGALIENSEYSLIELQCRLASKRWRIASQNEKYFSRIVWLQPGIKPNDERHKSFVGSLRVEEKDSTSEVIQTPLEELKTVLREKISHLINLSDDEKTDQLQKSVYLVHEKKDTAHTGEIADFLAKKGFNVLTIDFSGATQQLVSTHYEYLSVAESVIVCDFNSQKQWIDSKLKDLIKAPGYGRSKPFLVQAIFTKNKNLHTHQTQMGTTIMLDANGGIEKAMVPFLEKLNLK